MMDQKKNHLLSEPNSQKEKIKTIKDQKLLHPGPSKMEKEKQDKQC